MSAMPYRARPPRRANVPPQTIERAGLEKDLAFHSLTALAPPYDALTLLPLSDSTLPQPGTIVVGSARPSIIAAFYELTVAAMEWPWVVPCLVMPATGESPGRFPMLITDLRERLAIARLTPNDAPRIAHILDAVRRRELPNAGLLAHWVARRLGAAELEPLLLAQFREALDGVRATDTASVATFCRHFARNGPYTPRHWRALARFCVCVAGFGATNAKPRACLASRLRADYARKFLGVTAGELPRRAGWEWVAECALRQAGYIAI